jgi:hypothetical protein
MDFIKEFLDFANHRGRFEDKNGYYAGMGASSYPETMVFYFETLDETERNAFIHSLVMYSLGKVSPLLDTRIMPHNLLFIFILHGYGKYLECYLDDLEEEFNNEEFLQRMINAEENNAILTGGKYKDDWHYGLILSVSIGSLRFDNIEKSYERLIREAKSLHFRESLMRNKNNNFFRDIP